MEVVSSLTFLTHLSSVPWHLITRTHFPSEAFIPQDLTCAPSPLSAVCSLSLCPLCPHQPSPAPPSLGPLSPEPRVAAGGAETTSRQRSASLSPGSATRADSGLHFTSGRPCFVWSSYHSDELGVRGCPVWSQIICWHCLHYIAVIREERWVDCYTSFQVFVFQLRLQRSSLAW